MGTIFVDNLEPQSGTSLTLGASGDAINLATGATAGFGKIGQVVQVSGNGGVSTTSTSFVAAPIAVTITPTATSSKVYVSIAFMNKTSSDQEFIATIYRDSTNLGDGTDGFFSDQSKVANSKNLVYMQYVDSPSTTSATEYKVYFKGEGQTVTANNDEADWAFIAMEILA
jgi:hypothetical protein